MDVDKLFKLPSLPSAAVNKRKWAAPKPEDPSSSSTVVSEPSSEAGPSSRPSKAARVDDEADEEYGNSHPDQDDDTYFFSDDDQEDGRFFGGGLTAEQQQILDIMDSNHPADSSISTDPSTTLDLASLRKQLVRFERAINKNAEMRVKYASDPVRFIDSEADLDAELKSLLVLTTQPVLFYAEFVKLGGAASLVGLLSHENADIAAAAIEVIEELTDDDVLDQANAESDHDAAAEGDGEGEKALAAMNMLVEALLEQSLLDLLVSNLSRFNDFLDPSLPPDQAATKAIEVEGDAQAIYHTLGAIENLVSSRVALSERLVAKTPFLTWTLQRLANANRSKSGVDQNKGYAAELLAILLQSSESNRLALGNTSAAATTSAGNFPEDAAENGIDILLGVLSRYRRRAPEGAEEEEFVENIFDSLCSALSQPANKQLFLDGEGVELMILFMKAKKGANTNASGSFSMGRVRAVKVLDHACSGPAGGDVCRRIVQALGLSPLFGVFMDCDLEAGSDSRKNKKKKKASKHREVTLQDLEHVLGILASMLTHLGSDSMDRIRLLTKFVAENYTSLDHLLDLRETFTSRLESIPPPAKEDDEDDEEDEEERYLTRLEQGLFSLQLLDTVLAWIVMEDDAAKDHISLLLRRKSKSLRHVAETLKEYRDNIGDQVSITDTSSSSDDHDPNSNSKRQDLKTRDILNALIAYIEAL